MESFRLALPLVLVLLPLPLLWLAPNIREWLQTRTNSMIYSDTRLFRGIPASWRVRLHHIPEVLRAFAWMLLVIALARPQAGDRVDVIRGQGIDIVLALDISTSMSALDFQPSNRLETAKSVISDFINGREFDRVGLVVFARSAFHQAPLTLDYNVLQELLDEVQLASELRASDGRRLDGTAIGLGLAASANMLRAGSAPSQVIVLLTDGDNNAGVAPSQAAAALAALDIRVYTIGMGRLGLVDIPAADGQMVTVESDLNEPALQAIADTTNGLYFRAEDSEALAQIYERIDRLERSTVERQIFTRWEDLASYFVGMAVIFLIVEQVLRQTVWQKIP